jgi:nicotinamide N-methyltransferase
MGVLLEPAEQAWTIGWHRDMIHNRADLNADEDRWRVVLHPRMFSQLNAALYDDHSLWVVPGSHLRRDTPEEWVVGTAGPGLTDGMSSLERELACLAHVRRMPGATPVSLYAGDVAYYRATAWHVGSYVPYVKRATLHDAFWGPEDRAWRAEQRRIYEQQAAAAVPAGR